METKSSSSPLPIPREPANFDEVTMQQSILFSDSLMDLKNLRRQLYSAAEYFELSYTHDDQKQIVVDTLKDYAIKALVNTVDHLGSATYEVNDLVDEKVEEVFGTELRVSCVEQRLRTCQESIDREGLSQQSLVISTPKYHRRYILPVGETMHGATITKSKYQGSNLDACSDWWQFKNVGKTRATQSLSDRKERSLSPCPQVSRRHANFSFIGTKSKKEPEKRTVSPRRFPLLRSGSHSSRPSTPNSRLTSPNSSRPTTPNPSTRRQRFPSETRKSASMHLHTKKENPKEIEQYPSSKSKRLLKGLLSRHKSKKDDMLYTYLDEY